MMVGDDKVLEWFSLRPRNAMLMLLLMKMKSILTKNCL